MFSGAAGEHPLFDLAPELAVFKFEWVGMNVASVLMGRGRACPFYIPELAPFLWGSTALGAKRWAIPSKQRSLEQRGAGR